MTPPLREEPVDLLLVDDRREDLLTLAHVLAGPEYRLTTASSGPGALRRLLEQDFGVILLDVFMPTMDGFELAELIKQRERNQHTPIIFLTAAISDLPQIYRGYSVGAVDYLTKPVDPDVVRAKVAVFADLFRKDRRLERYAQAVREGERRERDVLITELQHAAERRYMHLADAVPLGVWTAEPGGALSYANHYWTQYTGISLDAARGAGWMRAVHEADRDGYLQAWRESLETGTPFQQECRIHRVADGAHRWHLSRAVPERADSGQIVAWLGTHTDIEDSKQAVFARDEFLSIASHELRTPLTALKLRLQSVLHSRDLSGKTERRVESAVRHGAHQLERVVHQLGDAERQLRLLAPSRRRGREQEHALAAQIAMQQAARVQGFDAARELAKQPHEVREARSASGGEAVGECFTGDELGDEIWRARFDASVDDLAHERARHGPGGARLGLEDGRERRIFRDGRVEQLDHDGVAGPERVCPPEAAPAGAAACSAGRAGERTMQTMAAGDDTAGVGELVNVTELDRVGARHVDARRVDSDHVLHVLASRCHVAPDQGATGAPPESKHAMTESFIASTPRSSARWAALFALPCRRDHAPQATHEWNNATLSPRRVG